MRTCTSSDSSELHQFPDYLPYICHSLWFLPQGSLFLFPVCVLLVVLVLYYVLFILLKHSLNCLSVHIVREAEKPPVKRVVVVRAGQKQDSVLVF